MIIVRLQGGLGNQMFQYAFGKSFALNNKVEVKFDVTHLFARYKSKKRVFRTYDLDIFNISLKIATKKEILNYVIPRFNNKYIFNILDKIYKRKNVIFEKEFYKYDESIFNYKDNYYFIGYWQSYKYFQNFDDLIRKDFTIKLPLLHNSMDLYDEILNSNSVALNYRRTDYVSDPLLNTLMGSYGEKYYNEAIKKLTSIIENPCFYIFSDDIDWCKKNVKLNYKTIYVDHDHAGNKFYNYLKLMMSCKYFIIPNSTFAWWAAWLSTYTNKLVIAPHRWANIQNFVSDDLIPENWILI